MFSVLLSMVISATQPSMLVVVAPDDVEVYKDRFKDTVAAVVTVEAWEDGSVVGLEACTRPVVVPVAVRPGFPVSVPVLAESTVSSLSTDIDQALVERKKAEENCRKVYAERDSKRKTLENRAISVFKKIRELEAPDTIGNKKRTPDELIADVGKVPTAKLKELLPLVIELIAVQYELQKTGDSYWWDKVEWHPDVVTGP